MTEQNWADGDARCLAIYLDGTDDPDASESGEPLCDDDFLVLVNAWWEPVPFTIPRGARHATGVARGAGQL